MQVTETLADGLKREYRVVVPATELDAQVNEKLDELKGHVRLNGFRPGKVPAATSSACMAARPWPRRSKAQCGKPTPRSCTDNNLRLAMEPQVKLPTEEKAIEAVVEGKADLDYSVAMEVLPQIELDELQGYQARTADD